jgi:hypothetical protein
MIMKSKTEGALPPLFYFGLPDRIREPKLADFVVKFLFELPQVFQILADLRGSNHQPR